jgi:hypothetical protein
MGVELPAASTDFFGNEARGNGIDCGTGGVGMPGGFPLLRSGRLQPRHFAWHNNTGGRRGAAFGGVGKLSSVQLREFLRRL